MPAPAPADPTANRICDSFGIVWQSEETFGAKGYRWAVLRVGHGVGEHFDVVRLWDGIATRVGQSYSESDAIAEAEQRTTATYRAHAALTCNAEASDGNRDDASFAYCDLPHAHAGDHHYAI